VSPLDGRLKILRDTTGPNFYAFGAIRVRGFTIINMKLSPYELPTAEMPV
jgi:hypothetical protein